VTLPHHSPSNRPQWPAGAPPPSLALRRLSASGTEEILDWVKQAAETTYHPVGTCKMGSDPLAVVDAQLRVHGIAGLRVADASIMPTLTSGNTNAPSIIIGEKARSSAQFTHPRLGKLTVGLPARGRPLRPQPRSSLVKRTRQRRGRFWFLVREGAFTFCGNSELSGSSPSADGDPCAYRPDSHGRSHAGIPAAFFRQVVSTSSRSRSAQGGDSRCVD
jgi:hypothetical protein